MKELEGRVAVVTGGGSGIGLSMARRFISQGMKVVVADVDPELDSVVDGLRDQGADVIGVHADVSDWAAVEALRDETLRAFGTVHIVCNNAGSAIQLPIRDVPLDYWRFELGVNLMGPIHGIRAFLPLLRAQDEGHIVATSSMSGFLPFALSAPYNVAKAGVIALIETLHHELVLEGSNVRASVVCPGAVRTNLARSAVRNRPDSVRGQLPPQPDIVEDPFEASVRVHGTQSPAASPMAVVEPDVVADLVLGGIRTEKLYIFTHPVLLRLVEQRFDAIVSGRNPVLDIANVAT